MTQVDQFIDALQANPQGLTVREIHIHCWIQNVPDVAMQARKQGWIVTTEYLHPNPKIATYVLHGRKQPQAAPVRKVPAINLLPIQGSLL